METITGEYVMKVVVVGMIYKSQKWLKSMCESLSKTTLKKQHSFDVDYLIVANDANAEVLDCLKTNKIKHIIYNDPDPYDYYLNRVYRAWNFGGFNADGDVIVFVNSDMIFSHGWLDNLINKLDENTLPCSMLIESGKMESGKHAMSINCGQTLETFNLDVFEYTASDVSFDSVGDGGLYMPCAFYKKDFVASGGYPEGNIYTGGVGDKSSSFVMSGDHYFFYENPIMKNKKHITVFDSVVYHFQTGEMDS